MAVEVELTTEVRQIFRSTWTSRTGTVVPESEDLGLGNDAVNLEATVLYADISDSTGLVDGYQPAFAAEIYKAYLHCAAKIISVRGGSITAYDGDRIMAVFIGGTKNTSAAHAALNINYAVDKIITPEVLRQYPETPFRLKHSIGVDTSKVFVARTGIR